MPRVVKVSSNRRLTLMERSDVPLEPQQVRIAVSFASPKNGTLQHLLSGVSPFEGRRFDSQLRLFVDDGASQPLVGASFGTMVTGKISAVGAQVDPARVGDRVYAWAEIAETVVVDGSQAKVLPKELEDADGVCLDPALYAYAAIRDGRAGLGDRVAVFGLGAIGLCVVSLLRAAGCEQVIAVDPVASRRQAAIRAGADAVIDPRIEDVGLALRQLCGPGPDLAVEASGNYNGLAGAIRGVRQCGRIVTLGYYQGQANAIALGAEWLHNRLELVCSMPEWGNPSREYPRWDFARLERAVLSSFARRVLDGRRLIDRIIDLDELPQAWDTITRDPAWAIKIGVRMPATSLHNN